MSSASSSLDRARSSSQNRIRSISEPLPRQWQSADQPPPRVTGSNIKGKYQVTRRLGQGASCRVYEAIRLTDNQKVAIKILLRTTPTGMARFQRELTIHRRLKHPNIVSLLDAGYRDHRPYLVIEYLHGKTLEEVLDARGFLKARHIVGIAEGLAAGLGAMHGTGFVHRDLKPSNIFLGRTDGGTDLTVKLIDFGLAKGIADLTDVAQGDITEENRCCGTPRYMAPEHILGAEAGAAADIYAVGAVMWEMLTGSAPFPDPDPIKVMHCHVEHPLPDLDECLPQGNTCPTPLKQLILRCLTKNPDDRFPNGNALLYALRDARRRIQALQQHQR